MKTKFSKLSLLTMIILCFGLIMSSCVQNDFVEEPQPSEVSLKSAHMSTCDLIAGKYMVAGAVSYEVHNGEVTVTIEVNDPWSLTEVHIYAGPKDGIPMNKKAIKIGHFPVSEGDLGGVNSFSKTLTVLPGDYPILAVHAVVVDDMGNEETAWGKCGDQVFTVKARLMYDSYTLWGVSNGDFLFGDNTNWCKDMGFNDYENGTYDLVDLFGSHGVIGSIDINGDEVVITPTLEGLQLCDSYVYVGPEGGVATTPDGCPDYPNFDNTIVGTCAEAPHTHSGIMLSTGESISFKTAFEISRWGWVIKLY